MYHTLILAGNVGRDPEMRYTPAGQPVTSFSVATNRSYTGNSGETVKETVWFQATVWGKLAEICNQYVQKGSKVLIEGRLVPDPATGGPKVWTGQDGAPRASFNVNAGTVRFLSSSQHQGAPAEGDEFHGPIPEDDIPF
jgi:single-strand DNA-binding protein